MVRSTDTAQIDVAVATIQGQFVAGADRDALLADTRASTGQQTSPERTGRMAGYAVNSYSADTAAISIALQADAYPGKYAVLQVVLRWINEDWRMVPPVGGTWAGAGRSVTQLTGFTAWSAR
jgi:hypothetical protein